jgi:hypothetical protein
MSTKPTLVFGESFLYRDARLRREAHLPTVLTTIHDERAAQRLLLRHIAHFSAPSPPDASTLHTYPASFAP